LDAILVYRSNATQVAKHLTIQTLVGVEGVRAQQPYAVARDSDHKQLMQRLQARLRTAASAERFQALGFEWQAGGLPR
jgi:hypothetical protein